MLMMTTMMSNTARQSSKELKIDLISGCLKKGKEYGEKFYNYFLIILSPFCASFREVCKIYCKTFFHYLSLCKIQTQQLSISLRICNLSVCWCI